MTGMSGLTVGGGFSSSLTNPGSLANLEILKIHTVYATYAVGGLTVGYQWSEADLGTFNRCNNNTITMVMV